MANNIDILGDAAALDQFMFGDYTDTNYTFEDNQITVLRRSAFRSGLWSLKKIKLPNCIKLGGSAFDGTYNLRIVDVKQLGSGEQSIFNAAWRLRAVCLRSETVSPLYHTNCFGDTFFATNRTEDTAHIYVPRNLISTYQTATNWSGIYAAHPNVFRALEDYTIDGTIEGELDESKVFIPTTPVYRLQNREFNGTSDYVDTGVQLFDGTGDGFVIFLDVTLTKSYGDTVTNGSILDCYDESTSRGFAFRKMNRNNQDHMKYFPPGGTTERSMNYTLVEGERYRVCIEVFNSYLQPRTYIYTTNMTKNGTSDVQSSTGGTITSMNRTLLIGAGKNSSGNIAKYRAMTVHDCQVFKSKVDGWQMYDFLYQPEGGTA